MIETCDSVHERVSGLWSVYCSCDSVHERVSGLWSVYCSCDSVHERISGLWSVYCSCDSVHERVSGLWSVYCSCFTDGVGVVECSLFVLYRRGGGSGVFIVRALQTGRG